MNNYFFINGSPQKDDVYFSEADCSDFLKSNIDNGISLADYKEPIRLTIREGGKNETDYPSRATVIPIVSSAFKALLEKLENSKNLEFFPVQITGEKKIEKTYWALNILNNVKCFDWEESEYEKMPPTAKVTDKPWEIHKLLIKRDAVGDRHIFRMYEEPVEIIVSQKLRNAIETNKLTGVSFRTLDKYGDISW